MSDQLKPTTTAPVTETPAAATDASAATAPSTATTDAVAPDSKGKGKGKAPQPADDDDDDDDDEDDEDEDDDEDDEDLDEVVEDFDGQDGLDPKNILPSRPRRAAASKVSDYSSEDAIRKAGIKADGEGSKDEEDEDASYMDTADDN
ncbi:unnamed protein product [Tilletia controversa]|uniref:Histone chaperone domain-containing protein n=1 Tax=Tilletia controversa TaxID=13291 RepID=A0A8X7MV18_9BASI|nr:hypothetical protein A4X06_0g3275 [Tilletia controversa]CAD6919115.1 unnamed protein product [Tilletia controversa]CAD6922309.1 unnamed protein product [Tilletia controversa]CAD6969856.1 unnamed protein product [Tilletia controversa]CAD6979246.1 unnamed protein product [Tilletia controversa]